MGPGGGHAVAAPPHQRAEHAEASQHCELRFFLALLALIACEGAQADEVLLRNGDRISGEALAKAAGKLVVRTAYAGEISIDWNEVASITFDAPTQVLFEGASEPVRLRQLGAELRDVAYLNPKPHELGNGLTYAGRATLSAAYASGNTESERLYADAELSARALAYRYQLSGRVEQRSEPLAQDVSAWRGGANYDRFLDARRFVYVRGSLEHDRAKDLRRRTAAGFGYGTQFAETERFSLSLRGGLDYLSEERYATQDEHYPALGWGLSAKYVPWGPRLELFHEHEGFRNLDDSALVLRSKTGLRMPLVARMSATAQLNVDWESRPAAGRDSTDSILLLGIDYAW
jgi:putative salt-induced outer membrane protein YdiY